MNTLKCNVVMLPRKSQSWCQGGILKALAATPCHKEGQIELCGVSANGVGLSVLDKRLQLQHLYFTSDEPIKEGEWYMLRTNINGEYRLSNDWDTKRRADKKVVASTDPSLGLPRIPEEWIRTKYVPANGEITDVKIEIIWGGCDILNYSDYGFQCTDECITGNCKEVKLTAHNEVVVVEEEPVDYYAKLKAEGLSDEEIAEGYILPSDLTAEEQEAASKEFGIYLQARREATALYIKIATENGWITDGDKVAYKAGFMDCFFALKGINR